MIERGLSARTSPLHTCGMKGLRCGRRCDGVCCSRIRSMVSKSRSRSEAKCVHSTWSRRGFSQGCAGTPYGPVLAVALTTGMRPSEYLALKWQDLDRTRQTVSVVRSVRRLTGDGVSQIPSVREAVVRSGCRAGLLPFFVICRLKRVRRICIQRHMTWSSERRLDSQSMPIISPSTSDQYSTSRGAKNKAL